MGTQIALLVLAFFIGAIPCGYVVGRLHGRDIRKEGSGNIGATNAARVFGKRAGVLVLIGDVLKAVLAVSLGNLFAGVVSPGSDGLASSDLFSDPRAFTAALGLAAILGHCFSPFLHFKGGKGVACGLGAFLVVAPLPTLFATTVFFVVFWRTRFVSLSSIAAAGSFPLLLLALHALGDRRYPLSVIALGTLAAGVIIYRHRSNIARLRTGDEPRYVRAQAL